MRYDVREYNPTDENWTTITRNKDKYRNKSNQIDVIKKTHRDYTKYNCFKPLVNLKGMQPSNMTAQYKKGKQHQTGNTVRNTTDLASRREIPPTVNRNINSHKDIVTQPRARKQCFKSNKHTVKINGDSHLRDSVTRINQYLNSKYEATGLIKPGATTKKIVTSGENEFQGLGEKDVIVLNCGANDIEKVNSSISAIITPVIDFSQKYSNTNIIVLEIPHRHDLHYKDLTNIRIRSLNTKLKSVLSRFKHVTILDINISRNYFTKYGMHLNKLGKEWLARKIASQIDKIIATREILGNSIPLNMTNEIPNTKSTNTEAQQEDNQTNQQTTTSQGQLTQDVNATTHNNNRSSTRVKKPPSVMYNDFYGELKLKCKKTNPQ